MSQIDNLKAMLASCKVHHYEEFVDGYFLVYTSVGLCFCFDAKQELCNLALEQDKWQRREPHTALPAQPQADLEAFYAHCRERGLL